MTVKKIKSGNASSGRKLILYYRNEKGINTKKNESRIHIFDPALKYRIAKTEFQNSKERENKSF